MGKRRPKILIVEDEEFVRSLLQEVLEFKGMEVLAASSGREALEVFSQYKDELDLVILDLVLPEMMGEEIFMALKEMDPQVKVLVTTGMGAAPSLERLLESGAKGVVTKPFNFAELLEKVRSILHE